MRLIKFLIIISFLVNLSCQSKIEDDKNTQSLIIVEETENIPINNDEDEASPIDDNETEQNPTDDEEMQNEDYPDWSFEVDEDTHNQIEDKLFLQFAPRAPYYVNGDIWTEDWDKWEYLINNDADLKLFKWSGDWAFLETKDGSPIPLTTIEDLKANPLIGSVSYPYEYPYDIEKIGIFQGLRNEFVVKLKETVTYEQLHQLAESYNCSVRKSESLPNNQLYINVPKTSELNAIQISKLFKETGFFDYVQPEFVIANFPNYFQGYNRFLFALKDEPAIVRNGCFSQSGEKNAYYFDLVNYYYGSDVYLQNVFPVFEIPEPFRKDGLSVAISGNVISVGTGFCTDPNARSLPLNLFEIKSIKINNNN